MNTLYVGLIKSSVMTLAKAQQLAREHTDETVIIKIIDTCGLLKPGYVTVQFWQA